LVVRSSAIGPQWMPAAGSVASTFDTHTAGYGDVTGIASTEHSQCSPAGARLP
jgi:hypothetical protein